MQHHNKNRKFGRKRNVRLALLRGLARSLIEHEKITTTEAKAKSLRPFVEQLITRSKEDTVQNRRLVASRLGAQNGIVQKLFSTIGPRYKERSGGYTRIVRLRRRQGDAATESYIGLI